MNNTTQIPISFGTAKYEVFVPDKFSKERQFGVPNYLIEHIRDTKKDLIVYDNVKDELMILNVFELFVDYLDADLRVNYQYDTYNLLYHQFVPNDSNEAKELLNVTERTLLKRFHWTWYNALKDTIDSGEFRNITKAIQEERKKGIVIYPTKENVFNCFQLDMNDISVIILGQDPYANDLATGYAFATKSYRTPSIKMIEKALKEQFESEHLLKTDLTHWIKQGVLLLNSALTIRGGESGSHTELWRPFIRRVIQAINLLNKPICVITMGGRAATYIKKFNDKHTIIEIEHPARASHEERNWIHGNCFLLANEFLLQNNAPTIKWIS